MRCRKETCGLTAAKGELYVWYDNVWLGISDATGPQGPQGDQGSMGPAGEKGEQGEHG